MNFNSRSNLARGWWFSSCCKWWRGCPSGQNWLLLYLQWPA